MSDTPTEDTPDGGPLASAAPDAPGASAAPEAPGASAQTSDAPPRRSPGAAWVRFAVGFAALELLFEVLYQAVALESALFERFLEALAQASGWVLTPFYESVKVTGTRLAIPGFTVEVDYGCDGIQVCTLLMAAVLAFPAPLRTKLIGIAIGLPWLQAWNVARISSLVAVGKGLGYPIFQTTHVYVWPTVLVIVSLLSWIGWARWAAPDDF